MQFLRNIFGELKEAADNLSRMSKLTRSSRHGYSITQAKQPSKQQVNVQTKDETDSEKPIHDKTDSSRLR